MQDLRGGLLGASLALCLCACSGGGGGDPLSSSDFELVALSVNEGSLWQINREIVLTFSAAVDFATVTANTVEILSESGVPATGIYRLRTPETVAFQPTCPTRADLSDAGLQPGGVRYRLEVKGRSSRPADTVRSSEGRPLGVTQVRHFTTPAPSMAFQDPRPGPPFPVLRAAGSSEREATHLELGHDPARRVYFERDATGEPVLSQPGFEAALNLYSEPRSAVALVIEFDQPVNPSPGNISPERLGLEYLDGSVWRPFDTRVTLEQNCTETGARVRLEPLGVLPSRRLLRGVVRAGFQDLVGQTHASGDDPALNRFAEVPTEAIDFPFLQPRDELSDELKEDFDLGGDGPLSLEDTQALFDAPRADWSAGRLAAAFAFDGEGGPGGDFDWVVRAGELQFFNTVQDSIIGGPGGIPVSSQIVVGGVVDVRHLIIEEGGEIRVQGPNPMQINATGDVIVRGRLDLSGFNAKDVASFGTPRQQEVGGVGAAGGGRGGVGNPITSASSPRGGTGEGPFGLTGIGGQGGESGYYPTTSQNNKDSRRPGGGGGGRFAADWQGTQQASSCSVAAGPGHNGHTTAFGASPNDGHREPRGGSPGAGAFSDPSSANDFFGVRPVVQDGALVALIRGELPGLWAGYGGGGGGNSARTATFPTPNWASNPDDKGGGGGGAAGALRVKALGRIVFGRRGVILANGGHGGAGGNTNFTDHIGGTGGGGSGGHVVLESASLVDFTDGGANQGADVGEFVLACGAPLYAGPQAYVNACCHQMSNGGEGGAGVIQIHVPRPLAPPGSDPASTSLLVPGAALQEPDPLDRMTSPPAYTLIPTFGARSKVRSRWVSIGAADLAPDGSRRLVRFLFGGTEPASGAVLSDGSSVREPEPLLLGSLEDPSEATIGVDGSTLILRGAALVRLRNGTSGGLSNDLYLRTPALLEDFTLSVELAGNPEDGDEFGVVAATLEPGEAAPGDEELRLQVTRTPRHTLQDLVDELAGRGHPGYRLFPRFFRVLGDGVVDHLPPSAAVRIRFQAARDNGRGAPDELELLQDWTGDLSSFNQLPPGALQYFRFEVEFDLDAQGQGVSAATRPLALDFLRVPFRF